MNFSVIINRLLIGALAFTVFPFYTYAQNDKVERQTAHRTKAWEIGVGGALINWDSDFLGFSSGRWELSVSNEYRSSFWRYPTLCSS